MSRNPPNGTEEFDLSHPIHPPNISSTKMEEIPHEKKLYLWMDTAHVRVATVTTSKNSLEQIKFTESLACLIIFGYLQTFVKYTP